MLIRLVQTASAEASTSSPFCRMSHEIELESNPMHDLRGQGKRRKNNIDSSSYLTMSP